MFGYSNATLTIPIYPTSPVGFDPYTGEPNFGTLVTEMVKCVLEEKSPPRELTLPGQDTAIAYLEGRILGTPHAQLTANNFYAITITLQNQTLTGRFYLVSTPISRFNLESVFGVAIAGWLVK